MWGNPEVRLINFSFSEFPFGRLGVNKEVVGIHILSFFGANQVLTRAAGPLWWNQQNNAGDGELFQEQQEHSSIKTLIGTNLSIKTDYGDRLCKHQPKAPG
jgi:hypothetical protein